MKFGLDENVVADIQEIFREFPQVDEVILYGSRAKGNFRTGSDIDFTLKGKGLNLSVINKISLCLDELYLPYIFDLSIYTQIENQDLLEHIDRAGKTFYLKSRKEPQLP